MHKKPDAVDDIAQAWQDEKPDLSTKAMTALGRLKRCSVLYQPLLDQIFARFELNSWEFDVLATLRRAGQPYRLLPTQLFNSLMVTSGTMTHRLKALEARGLISRVLSKEDARQKAVQLTKTGYQLVERALPAHVNNMESILAELSEQEQKNLSQVLRKLMVVLEARHRQDATLQKKLTDRSHGL